MFGRNKTATRAPPVECNGRILNRAPYLFGGGYTFITVAILVELPDGGEEVVLEYSNSASVKALALCKPGHKVKVSLDRESSEAPWSIQNFKIDYDVKGEKLALEKLTG
ncbi:MAG: hypothetical protein P4L53_09205 [Candidatus Obscuribacterales bacterium]|nr:hypothetical protein [Candidatus Obscuribacterales bacterium]